MIIGYARVSTTEQNVSAQLDALEQAGCERIFTDKMSGSTMERPQLARMLDHLRAGDVVTVTKYDRLARSLQNLLAIVQEIEAKKADFRSLAEQIDTTTPAGRLAFHIFGSVAEFERARIAERTREGLLAARKQGRIGGRPRALSEEQKVEVRRMKQGEGEERRTIPQIARLFKVSEATIRRA